MKIIDKMQFSIPHQNSPTLSVEVTVLLTIGVSNDPEHKGDHAAYIGIGSNAWVAHSGQKLLLREAQRYFPHLTEELYRP